MFTAAYNRVRKLAPIVRRDPPAPEARNEFSQRHGVTQGPVEPAMEVPRDTITTPRLSPPSRAPAAMTAPTFIPSFRAVPTEPLAPRQIRTEEENVALVFNVSKILETERVFSLVTKSIPFLQLSNVRPRVKQALDQNRYYSIETNEFVTEPEEIMRQDVYPFPQLAALVLNLDPSSGLISDPLNFFFGCIDNTKNSAMEDDDGNGLGLAVYRETIECHSYFATTKYFAMLTAYGDNRKRTPVFIESKMKILRDWMKSFDLILQDIKKNIILKAHINELEADGYEKEEAIMRHMEKRGQL